MFRISYIFAALALLVCTGCGMDAVTEAAPISLPEFVTATLPLTSAPLPTPTALPPTAAPTLPPIQGVTNTQINVRAETNSASQSYGVILPFTTVQITGKESMGTWFQIAYADSPTGSGWVRAEYIQVDPTAEVQVLGAESGSGTGMSGLVISGINVRSGPGTNYESLGVLIPKDVVFVTGRNAGGSWVQFRFSPSPDGLGWASAEFLQMENTDSLPVVGEPEEALVEMPTGQNSPVGFQMAQPDGDSAASPMAAVTISPAGSRSVLIHGAVSSPDGDLEDWLAFSSFTEKISLQLSCESGGLLVELFQSGSVKESNFIPCESGTILTIPAKIDHQLRITNSASEEPLFTEYELILEVVP